MSLFGAMPLTSLAPKPSGSRDAQNGFSVSISNFIPMSKRKAIPKKIRFEVFKRDKFTCQYCGESAPDTVLEIDHIIPFAKGGSDDILNLVTSCEDCNAGKSDRMLSDNSVIERQKKQLKEFADKHEQLEMLIKWREEIKGLGETAAQLAIKEIESYMIGESLNENGKKKVRLWIKKFGISLILDCIDISFSQYAGKDFEFIFAKIPRIAFHKLNEQESPYPEFHYHINYLCKIVSSNCWTYRSYEIRPLIEKNLLQFSFSTLKAGLSGIRNYNDVLDYLLKDLKGKNA